MLWYVFTDLKSFLMSVGLNYHGVRCGLVLQSPFNPVISHKFNDCSPCPKNKFRLWDVNKMKGEVYLV